MSTLDVMKRDIRDLATTGIVVAVVFGVVARVYALFGSPAANAWLQSMGPVGQSLSSFVIAILYLVLLIAAVVRRNMLVTYLAALIMAIIRILTGDPFGPVAIQAYFLGGLLGWIAFATLKDQHSYKAWAIASFFFVFGVDFVFYTFYLPVYPIAGSTLIGWLLQVVVYRIIIGLILGAILKAIGDAVYKSEALKGAVVSARQLAG